MSIIDIILNIFRADNTHIYIFWGMIISAFILMIDYRFRVFSPVKRDLKRLKSFFSKTVDSESFSEHIEDINQKIEESRYGTIKNLWSEFQETLTTNKDNDDRLIYYNTKRPDEYFTPEALLKDKGNFNSLENWSGIFIGIGLLFTFLGLIAALEQASSSISNQKEIKQVMVALENLLKISSIKFITSVAGIFCSIIISVYSRSINFNISRDLRNFNDQLEKCLTFIPAEKLQQNMIDAILGMSDSIAKGVSEGVQSIAGTELRDFASSMGSISETLSKSKSDVKGLGKVYAEELENIKKALDNSLGSVSKQLNDWTEDMNNVLKANLSDTNNVLVGFVDNLEKAIDTSNRASIEFNKDITVQMSDAANSLGSNIKSLNNSVEKQLGSSQEYLSKINDASASLITDTQNVTNTLGELIQKLTSGDNDFSKGIKEFESKINELSQSMGNNVSSIDKISESFKNEIATLQNKDNTVRQQLQTSVNQFSTSIESTVNQFDKLRDEMKTVFDPLKNSVEELSKKIDEKSKKSLFKNFFGR